MWILEVLKFYVWLALYFCWIALAWLINGFASFCSNLTFSARSFLATLSKSAPFPSTFLDLFCFKALFTSDILYFLLINIFFVLPHTRLPFMRVFLSVLFIIVSSPWHIINMHNFFTLGNLLHLNSHVSACYSIHPSIHPSTVSGT